MRRWAVALVIGVTLAIVGMLVTAIQARADAGDGTFQITMTGQVTSSHVQSTDAQGASTIIAALELQTTAGYDPAVTLLLDLTEHMPAKGNGTLMGTGHLTDLQQQASLFAADVQGTVVPGAQGTTTVTYTLQNAHADVGQGGTLAWQGVWRGNKLGALNATAQGTLLFPTGTSRATIAAVWSAALTTQAAAAIDPTLWYLTRGAASAAYVVLVATTLLGMGISTQAFDSVTQRWRVLDLHQVLTLLMLALIALHLVTLALDPFLTFGIGNLFWPIDEPYRAVPTALGVLALYALLVVTVSSWARKWLSYGFWRVVHYLSLVGFVLLTLHGVLAGTDSATPWMIGVYVTSSVAVSALGLLRAAQAIARSRRRARIAHA